VSSSTVAGRMSSGGPSEPTVTSLSYE
jgi:hypothetical protein